MSKILPKVVRHIIIMYKTIDFIEYKIFPGMV